MAHVFSQRESVTQKNTAAVWMDGSTLPSRFTLNDQIHSVIITYLVSDIQYNISNTKFTSTYGLVPLPPVTGPTSHITPIVVTGGNSAGKYFVMRVTLKLN